jgi:hypothetical protein
MGAIASGGVRVINPRVSQALDLPQDAVDAVAAREQRELERREHDYRDGDAPAPVAGRTAILVDHGLATGSSIRAAVEALRQRQAARIVVAVPIAPPAACSESERDADAVVSPAPRALPRRRRLVRPLRSDHRRRGPRAARQGPQRAPNSRGPVTPTPDRRSCSRTPSARATMTKDSG